MARFIRTSSGRQYLHKGNAESYELEEGTFEVRQQGGVRTFQAQVAAYLNFADLEAGASIWDVAEEAVEVGNKLLVETFPN